MMSKMTKKTYITKEQAISILPDGELIHTFYNPWFGLVGADWSKDDIIDKIQKSDILELTGPSTRSMGCGMCAYSKDAQYQGDILFIETDENRLDALERELEKLNDEESRDKIRL
ncbi:hypothetical protein WGC32_14330 [Zongyangia sp. HA2173]|uniref:hypothetical protein n=1 Tax=Zongyangia sp. HA2173 TaxID=3133035 RepID=UPI00315FB2A4